QEPQTTTQPVQTPAPSPAQTVPPSATQTRTPAQRPPKPPVLRHRKRKRAGKTGSPHKKTPAHKSSSETSKVVVRNGGAKEGVAQLTPATSPGQAQQQRASTASLLAATDANLKRIAGRQLTPAQQSMNGQIHT